MHQYTYETIEIVNTAQLLVSVDASKLEIPIKSFVRNSGLDIVVEEVQSKYIQGCTLSPEDIYDRSGFLYQALLEGPNLEEIKSQLVELVKQVRLCEKCYQLNLEKETV